MTEQRIKIRKDKFVPQYRKVYLWGVLKLWWKDYTQDVWSDPIFGSEQTSCEFNTHLEAMLYLRMN